MRGWSIKYENYSVKYSKVVNIESCLITSIPTKINEIENWKHDLYLNKMSSGNGLMIKLRLLHE